MIELMVVVGIIIVLLGLIVSVAQRTIESSKQRQTKIILTVLDNAIQEFASENPFSARRRADPDYDAFFGPFPPMYDRVTGPGGSYHAHVGPALTDPFTTYFWRTLRLWQRIDDPAIVVPPTNSYTPDLLGAVILDQANYLNHLDNNVFAATKRDDLENIQGLCFYLRRFSPAASTLLGNLPESSITNNGRYSPTSPTFSAGLDVLNDTVALGNRADDVALSELRDPWDNLLSYWVYFFREDPNAGLTGRDGTYGNDASEALIDPLPVIESAGPDGKFGHRPGEPVDPTDADAVKAAADNVFSREPPWK